MITIEFIMLIFKCCVRFGRHSQTPDVWYGRARSDLTVCGVVVALAVVREEPFY